MTEIKTGIKLSNPEPPPLSGTRMPATPERVVKIGDFDFNTGPKGKMWANPPPGGITAEVAAQLMRSSSKGLVVGRGTIKAEIPTLSRKHVHILPLPNGEFQIKDPGSKNGTLVFLPGGNDWQEVGKEPMKVPTGTIVCCVKNYNEPGVKLAWFQLLPYQ